MIPSRNINTKFGLNRGLIAETGEIPRGYQLIQDTFAFEVLDKKNTIAEDINGREQPVMRVTGLFQQGDAQNANGRVYPTNDVLGPAVRAIQEDVSRRSVMGEYDHPCVLSPNFRVLTVDNGWKDFLDIKVGDYVWSRVNGKMVKSRVNSLINEPYDGTAYRIAGKNINVEFTPGHRFLFERRPDRGDHTQIYATVDDIYSNRKKYNHCRVPQTAIYEQQTPKTIIIKGVKDLVKDQKYYEADAGGSISDDLILDSKLFASFMGLYLAEGSVINTTVSISQKNETCKNLIRHLLYQLEFSYKEVERGFNITDKRLANYLKLCGNVYTKHIPQEIKELDSECLEALVYWFSIGDGRMLVGARDERFLNDKTSIMEENGGTATATSLDLGKYSRIAIFTVSKRLIDDLHECVVKTGKCGRRSEVVPENDYVFAGREIKAQNKKVLYQLHISRNKGFNLDERFTSVEPFHHSGRIYCLSVDHSNFYMMANGCSYWTGNCDAKIHLDRVSHLITKLWMEGPKVYGEAEILHNLPLGAALRGLFEHKVRVGISSRGVGDMEVAESQGREIYRVMPGYAFVTWDAVAEPSVSGAVLNIQEGLNKKIRPLQKMQDQFSPQTYQKKLVKEINKYFGL